GSAFFAAGLLLSWRKRSLLGPTPCGVPGESRFLTEAPSLRRAFCFPGEGGLFWALRHAAFLAGAAYCWKRNFGGGPATFAVTCGLFWALRQAAFLAGAASCRKRFLCGGPFAFPGESGLF
ncbi:MAG: hypothetical protein LBT16_12185, partial [Treponema sp.]|nr:hypothetical protein [Treponema sp.]